MRSIPIFICKIQQGKYLNRYWKARVFFIKMVIMLFLYGHISFCLLESSQEKHSSQA